MDWIYILKCDNGYFYVSETTRLYRRFWEHFDGKGGVNTSTYNPENIIAIYKLNTLSTTELKGIISAGLANKNSTNSKGKTTFMINPEECLEKYKDCIDGATATYAAEQVACVGFGALGWTIIGGALFVACEAASNYHLYINDRTCRTNLKYCK